MFIALIFFSMYQRYVINTLYKVVLLKECSIQDQNIIITEHKNINRKLKSIINIDALTVVIDETSNIYVGIGGK